MHMDRFRKILGAARLPRDPLFRLLAINGAAGVAIAAIVLAGIFLANIGNLRELVMTSDNPVLPVIMLAFGLIITLGSVVMGSAIMLVGNSGGGGGTMRPLGKRGSGHNLQPARVSAVSHRRDRNI